MAPILKEDYKFKVISLGESNVGKTALISRYTENVYKCTVSTVAASFSSHTLELESGVRVNLNIWDTCGMEKFKALTSNYYHNVAGCLLVFDLTRQATFKSIDYWYKDILQARAPDKVVFVLVGQKCDDVENRQVTQEEAEQLAEALGMPYVETSALTGHNVEKVFEDLTRRMKDEGILSNVELNKHKVRLAQANKKKTCCS